MRPLSERSGLEDTMGAAESQERGSVLIMTVIAMLIMGVLSVSFALLSDVETKIGVNYKQQGQAEALAEAGLEMARDVVRPAATVPGGFTTWLNTVLASGSLGAGQYQARVDNDCAAANTVPASIEEPGGCDNVTDQNETAVITAWAQAGVGRARMRVIVGVDNPWKHVCSNAKPDNNGYCNDPSNQNGSPVITPADPNDPNGPAAYDDLPRPTLGCSRIDPTMHGADSFTCAAFPAMYTHPYPVGAPRMVMMGPDPNVPPGGPICHSDPIAGDYFGYFDCALQTPCDPFIDSGVAGGGGACQGGIRKACVRLGDTRAAADPAHYQTVVPDGLGGWVCPNDATGMVFNWYGDPSGTRGAAPTADEQSPEFNGYVGSCSGGAESGAATWDCQTPGTPNGRNIYVLTNPAVPGSGEVSILRTGAGRTHVYGTLAMEGIQEAAPGGCTAGLNDLELLNKGTITTAENNLDRNHAVYGYPLALLIFDPIQAMTWAPERPTVSPYNPQTTCSNMGSVNTGVNGMVYSGGHVQFNPISINGSVVGFELQTQGGNQANSTYNSTYGKKTPPPGFPSGAGNQVVIIRKSFIVCTNYNDETGGATACN